MGSAKATTDTDAFIARWQGREGGQERANYVSFLNELIALLGLDPPDPADATHENNDYVFERAVKKVRDDGNAHGRIDLYKKGSFVLEAKQSRFKGGKKEVAGTSDLFAVETADVSRGRRGADRAWDVLMMNAKRQAEEYARALPTSHGWPPFILVCDVGHCIEVYADFSGQGKNYTQFPDRQNFRIYLEDLRNEEVRERLRKIWDEPEKLDPAQASARVTRDIAKRLAQVSQALEKKNYPAEDVAMFLMRCLFTMFAEDVGLLPEKSFKDVLEDCEKNPDAFSPSVGQLWEAMRAGTWAHALKTKVKKFNGGFFENNAALPLGREEIGELRQAASYNWKEVDPSIFGTLLEQALDSTERRKLGAHYTPRAYVERLVIATVIEPLRKDWRNVQATAETLRGDGDLKGAAAAVQAFHDKLCETRVLDPACGTGNFLYVSLELMKRLEGEVLEALADLGGQEGLRGLGSHSVDPHQFLGLEINPRAAAIAELVLWIGYLQWHFRTRGAPPDEPILRAFKNIEVRDAVLTWDGAPVVQIVDGKNNYPNPRQTKWPEAEFIVGNPPFVSNRKMRELFGDRYVEALSRSYNRFDQAADYVLFFWLQSLLPRTNLPRRVGLVSTSRLRMQQNRAVFENALDNEWKIIFAIPDHSWPSEADAEVRVCFVTVSRGGELPLLMFAFDHDRVAGRARGDYEGYRSQYVTSISTDLSAGADLSQTNELESNRGMCHAGVKPYSRSLHINAEQRSLLLPIEKDAIAATKVIFNGHDLGQRWRGLYVIDLFRMSEDQVRLRFPRLYQYLLERVKPERAKERNPRLRSEFWLFEANREAMRDALKDIPSYIATLENSPQRYFVKLSTDVLPDQKLRVIVSDDAYIQGLLMSTYHETFARRVGGRAGRANTPVYNTQCFSKFPFPDANPIQKHTIRVIAEDLDAHRKRVLAEHPHLTLTGLYNVLEKIRAGAVLSVPSPLVGEGHGGGSTKQHIQRSATPPSPPLPHKGGESRQQAGRGKELSPAERRIFDDGLVLILKELHDKLDAAVAAAYGWPADLGDDEILGKLVALNKERAEEEKRGHVRWLRPDYQIPRFAKGVDKQAVAEDGAQVAADLVGDVVQKPAFPASAVEQTAAVFAALATAGDAIDAKRLAARFKPSKTSQKKIAAVLASLARLGYVTSNDGKRFALRRVA